MAKSGPQPWRVVATVLLGVALLIFFDHPVMWPLKIVVVFFHELSHALAAWATGGEVLAIGLGTNQSGVTLTRGGSPFVILNAGYVGSLLWGVGLLTASQRPGWSRPTLGLLAGLLGLVTLGYVRPFVSFGFLFAALVSIALGWAARRLRDDWASSGLSVLGTFSVLYSVLDVRDDVLSGRVTGASDATMLADLTGVPASIWGVGWLAAGGVTLLLWWRRVAR